MSGHSKWSTIKRKKAATDSKRSKLFTKLLREIQVAASIGGADPDANTRLRTAVINARSMSVPSDNIDRAIKRGSGTGDQTQYEEIMYEGFGPGGTAVMVKALTDNRNRTVSEVRHCLTRSGGSLGSTNSVNYLFQNRGVVQIAENLDDAAHAKHLEVLIDAGADDYEASEDGSLLFSAISLFDAVKDKAESLGLSIIEAKITFLPIVAHVIDEETSESVNKLLESLEDLDDVQEVYTNL